MKNPTGLIALTILFITVLSPFLLAQPADQLFIVESLADSQLTTTQLDKLDRLRDQGSYYAEIELIDIEEDSLTGGFGDGAIQFTIPWSDSTFTAEARTVEYIESGSLVWTGQISPLEGKIILVADTNGSIIGHFEIDTIKIELHDLSDDLYALALLDGSGTSDSLIECVAHPDSLNFAPPSGGAESGTCCRVRVLILFTDAADDVVDIDKTVELAFVQAREALYNTGVSYCQLNFQVVGIVNTDLDDQQSAGLFWTDLLNDQDIPDLMADPDVLADIAIVLTDGNFRNESLWGAAARGPNANIPYAFIEADRAIGYYTFIHELAHMLGAKHQQCDIYDSKTNPPSCNDDPGYEHGYQIKTGFFNVKRYTIVHQLIGGLGSRRLQYYSTPVKKYKGEELGTVYDNDNGRVLWENACTVAGFEDEPAVLYDASIIVDETAAPEEYLLVESEVKGGVSPYSYKWWDSYNGINYGSVISTQYATTVRMPTEAQAPYGLFLKLEVTDDNNDVLTRYAHVLYDDVQYYKTTGITGVGNEALGRIFPNPAYENLYIELMQGRESDKVIENYVVIDGRGLQVEKGCISNRFTILDIKELPSGLYFVLLRTKEGQFTETHTLVIMR